MRFKLLKKNFKCRKTWHISILDRRMVWLTVWREWRWTYPTPTDGSVEFLQNSSTDASKKIVLQHGCLESQIQNRPLGSKIRNRPLESKIQNRPLGSKIKILDTRVQNPLTRVMQNSSTDVSKRIILPHGCRLIFHAKIAHFFSGVNVVGHRI